MKHHATWVAVAAVLAAALLAGCIEDKDYDELTYYRTVRRDPDGVIRGVSELTRRQAGTRSHWRLFITDGRAERMESYNKGGRLTSELRIGFDAAGHVSEERTYGPDKKLRSKLVIEYDAQDRITGFKQYSAEAGLKEERRWQYDTRGRLSEVRVIGRGGILRWHDKFFYDRKQPDTLLRVDRYDGNFKLIERIAGSKYTF